MSATKGRQSFGVDAAPETLFELPTRYASIPVFGYGAFRSNSGRLLERCRQAGLAGVLVEGVDDPVLWQLLAPRTASARRRQALEDAPRLLRLTEAVQLGAWNEVLRRVGEPVRTTDLARSLNLTREHLSREFGAGGAPNLKRVIDLATAICAADLLQSEAHTVRTVASILGGISPAQLNGIVRRVAGVTAPQLKQLGVRGVLREFLAGRTRSRL